MKKQCIKEILILVAVFIMGILLGNIIVYQIQDNKTSIELATQTESMMYLEKPLPIKHFLYEGATVASGGSLLDFDDDDDDDDDEIVIRPQLHNSTSPVIIPSTKEEISTEEVTTEEVTLDEPTTNEVITESEEESESNDNTTIDGEEVTTLEETTTPQYIINAQHYAVSAEEIYYTWPIREYTDEQKTLLAKMLYCEAGGEGWDCQVATCSAIINHIEHNGGNFGVLDKGNHFSPASYYRYKTPTKMNWEVLDYVLSGHLIANVKYFQLYNYHSFGTPMFKVGGVYFSR